MQTKRVLLSFLFASAVLSACSWESKPNPENQQIQPVGKTLPEGGEIPQETSQGDSNEIRLIRSDYSEGEIQLLCQNAITKVHERLEKIAQSKPARDFSSVREFESALADFSDETQPLTFMGYVSTDEKQRAEGSECEEKLGPIFVDIYSRRSLYHVLSKAQAASAEEQRLLDQTLQSFEKNGLKLTDEVLQQVKELKSRLAEKETQFSTNLNNDATTVVFTASELTGAPPSFLSRLEKTADGNFIVTTKSTDFTDVMQNVSVEETRKKMQLAYLNRGGQDNTKLLEEAVQLRAQIAKALGFQTWADYRTKDRMAKNGASVLQFLNDLKGKLAQRNQADMQQLLQFKKELDPQADRVHQWDLAYLSYQLQKRDYNLDNERIREYFPAQRVVEGIFSIYSKLLNVTYQEVKGASVWAKEVKLYEIREASDGQVIGYFYADLFPRPGKYGHAAAFPLISGRVLASGSYSLPVASMVANLTSPTADRPSLLTHEEVETFFHEFGHIMHQTLTRAPFASLSGSSVAQDFVEAPSQMLENWVWNPQMLSQISGHYLRPEEKLPKELVAQMIAAKNFQQGAYYTKQLLYALFDMTLHTQDGPVDVTETYDRLYRDIVGQEPLAGAHFPAGFGHLMGGYDAGYYGYLWSEVYAQDLFSQFAADDLMDPEVGVRYRKVILEQGNMKEPLELLREFLGREPSSDAFFKKLGL